MSKEFKQKWEAYRKGNLAGPELQEFEEELKRLEKYQQIIEHVEEEEKEDHEEKGMGGMAEKEGSKLQHQQRILRRGKWLARIKITFIVIFLLVIITGLSVILSFSYYTTGDRQHVVELVRHTYAVTEPNMHVRESGSIIKPFFQREIDFEIRKRIGSESFHIGHLDMSFLFSRMNGFPQMNLMLERRQDSYPFVHPDEIIDWYQTEQQKEWEKLDYLPEGTVSELFISLDQIYTIQEVGDLLQNRDISLLWYAVDTGLESDQYEEHVQSIGMPADILWHADDYVGGTILEEGRGWFQRNRARGFHSPLYEEEEFEQILEQQFLKTLRLLQKNESFVKRLSRATLLRLDERISYIEAHGATIYGIVLTGPTKELLALQEEDWIEQIQVGEVRLWNW